MIIAKFDDGRIISKLISGINFNLGDEQSYFADGTCQNPDCVRYTKSKDTEAGKDKVKKDGR